MPSRRYTVDPDRAFLGSTSRASAEGAPDISVGWVAAADADSAERKRGGEAEGAPIRLAGGGERGANAKVGAAIDDSNTVAHEAATCIVTMVCSKWSRWCATCSIYSRSRSRPQEAPSELNIKYFFLMLPKIYLT